MRAFGAKWAQMWKEATEGGEEPRGPQSTPGNDCGHSLFPNEPEGIEAKLLLVAV